MSSIDIDIKLRGGIFGANIPRVVHDALVGEVLRKVEERVQRPRRNPGLGARRNTVTPTLQGLELDITSTRRYPRTRGTSWQRKNIAIVKSMAPRVVRKAAERIALEMG